MDANEKKAQAGKMGFVGLVALCVSAMVGSGVFDLPKNMSQVAGVNGQLLAWITTGIGIWFIAETFVILSDVKPGMTAGLYKYGEAGFGAFAGFFTAWGYFVCECAANAAYAVLTMSTLDYFFPGMFTGGNNWPSVIGATVLTWALTALVLRGVEVSSTVQKVATAIMLAVVVVFLATVASHFNMHTFTTNANATQAIASRGDKPMGSLMHQLMSTMMVTLWLFGGVEGAVVMSGKARDAKQVPKATITGFIICIVMYTLVGMLSLGVYSYGHLATLTSPSTAYILTNLWHSTIGRDVITVALLFAVFASWISWIQMLAELPQHAAAEDGSFPKAFAKVSKNNVPSFSIIVATCVIQVIIIIAHFDLNAYQMLLTVVGTMTVPPYLISELYLIKISRKEGEFAEGSKHSRGKALTIALLAFAYTLIMGFAAGPRYIAIAFIVYALGIPLYMVARKQHNKVTFTKRELVFAVIIVLVAIYGVYALIAG
ncbi:histidine-histamine antiporter [Furfurilactobacillus siliginis]|uniref:Arginine/agmatine antiporter n=1 Tax=Furfurilactobacillus siliginis TaxID=348151 RepID=A0A0R2L3T3_9LACO|nr:histidine-histamine antiporter [Furfurilactobacillus siliginis]KRN96241.1 histidine histamine antiporter [Furfurilactobacillus siliginis]GEK27834.1 arginine/agmatine antiporter [Furfurilactobacillus siliginis]